MPRAANLRSSVNFHWDEPMTLERLIRIFAGAFVLASLALGVLVNPNFLWFTAFVGLNLFQSGFTGLCPLASILRRLGVRESAGACA